ncbi:sugar phosphate isomerase/epimerase [Candidatus Gracilibacteria bacterium]|nr:sugar phosphate isomerase/epimerase [Candidatus Gracilibacteria bacterium]
MLILCSDALKGYGLNRIFELAKKAKYDGIDLCMNIGQFDSWNSSYLKKLSKETGMPIHSVTAPEHLSTKEIKEVVEIAKKVGAKVVILQPPKVLDFKTAAWLKKEVPKLREKEGISIALENAPAGTFLGFLPSHSMSNTADLKDFKHISLDTARIGEKRKDIMRAYPSFKKFLVHVHLSNVFHGKKYAKPQEGILPLESFLAKLNQDKYPGAISIKVLPKHLHAGEDDLVVEELESIKKYYEKHYDKIEVTPED